MKWRAEQIIKLLQLYQQYPILYDIKDKTRNKKTLSNITFKELLKDVEESDLPRCNEEQLKKKIKSIRDVYRQELRKVTNSIETVGKGTGHVYEPTLAWYSVADEFLNEAMSSRRISYNVTSNCYESSRTLSDEERIDDDKESSCVDSKDDSENNSAPFRQNVKRKIPLKRKRENILNFNYLDSAIHKVNNSEKAIESEDINDIFGKLIASQLKTLPSKGQILARNEIQNVLTKKLLDHFSEVGSKEVEIIIDPDF